MAPRRGTGSRLLVERRSTRLWRELVKRGEGNVDWLDQSLTIISAPESRDRDIPRGTGGASSYFALDAEEDAAVWSDSEILGVEFGLIFETLAHLVAIYYLAKKDFPLGAVLPQKTYLTGQFDSLSRGSIAYRDE